MQFVAEARLADEVDGAQEQRGELATGRPKSIPGENTFTSTFSDAGLNAKAFHEARKVRDAIKDRPAAPQWPALRPSPIAPRRNYPGLEKKVSLYIALSSCASSGVAVRNCFARARAKVFTCLVSASDFG